MSATAILGHQYKHLAAGATTVVKSGSGVLHNITINTGTAGTITVYDNTAASGTVIAIITVPASAMATLTFDVAFYNGLTLVLSAATDITVSFR